MLPMLTVLALTSCSCNDEPAPPQAPGNGQVVLRLTVSDTSAGSRAPSTPEGGYDRGEGFENYIDIESMDFRFYFFGTDNKFIAPLEVAEVIPVESMMSSKTYMVYSFGMKDVYRPAGQGRSPCQLALVPAADRLEAGVTTIADIVAQQYDFDAKSMELSADRPVPLYGVSDPMTLSYDADNTADIGTLHLLRAYAKVEVNLNPDCVFPIEWVKLSRHNSRGYCAPQGIYSQSQYVYNDYDRDYTHAPSVPAGAETDSELEFIKVSDSRWLAYVPEYRNVGRPDDEKSAILIKFKGADTDVDRLYFATYDLTASPNVPSVHFDVMRNVWYKFTVKKNSPPLVQVVPYNEVDLGPLFGLLIGADYVPIYEEDGTIRYWYDHVTGKYFGPDKVTEIPTPM